MKLHFSIQELIEIQKSIQNTQYPTTRQAFEYRAKKENWPFNEVKSNGRNGSRREYLVPSDLAISIHNYQFSQSVKAIPDLPVTQSTNALVVASNVTPAQLADWQRQCAESRLIIVREIQQRVRSGVRKTKAIETLVIEQERIAAGIANSTLEALPFADQVAAPGCVHLTYSGSTSGWPAGTAVTDVKVMIGGAVRYTATQQFPIQKSITP